MTGTVFRVHWLPGTDVLQGTCHCGAVHEAEDPVELWTWLLGHPAGHHPGPAAPTATANTTTTVTAAARREPA